MQIRDMTADDLASAHTLSRGVSWSHRLEDWKFLIRIGRGVVAEEDGSVMGTAMGWPFGNDAAALGMVIVTPELQGKGIGQRLMDAITQRIGAKTLMLNATEQGKPLYRRLGFREERVVHQHQGAAFSVPIVAPSGRVRPMVAADRQALIDLDRQATGLSRAVLMSELLKKGKSIVLDRDDGPAGFATFRRFGRGHVVGPVVAPDLEGAKAMISHWLASNPGLFIRLDIPGDSGLCEWLNDLGITHVDQVTAMTLGPAPVRGDGVQTFALVSQALG